MERQGSVQRNRGRQQEARAQEVIDDERLITPTGQFNVHNHGGDVYSRAPRCCRSPTATPLLVAAACYGSEMKRDRSRTTGIEGGWIESAAAAGLGEVESAVNVCQSCLM